MLGAGSTTSWNPREVSMTRLSFNAIVSRRRYDMPEDMHMTVHMGRKATCDAPERYSPNGNWARQHAGHLPIRPHSSTGMSTMQMTGSSALLLPFTSSHLGLSQQNFSRSGSMMFEKPSSRESNHSRAGSSSGSRPASGSQLGRSWSSPML
eukprot:TRINITY_DN14065_c0_g3_i1.p1 TRINITY_DN14065_c0_g3~~TRINITY_DN14065_c0_g3_i1.p1  ORF type:complete len:151 (+),score=3.38 TRINITY_DN14065_c0_g3_i1:71-523(+)